MDANVMSSPCKECNEEDEGQLHAAVAHLRQHLADRDSHIISLEDECYKSSLRTKDLEEQLTTWREKYERLYDSHKRVQKLNQVLEDKLLQMVDKMKSEKSQLTKDIATLSVRLAESKHNYSMLQKENERYKNDMNLAIQLLQCKPDNFVSQRLDNLPVDTQARVSQYVMSKATKSVSSTHSKNGNEHDTFDASEYEFNISASLMTKILEDSIQDTVTKHCDTCTCSKSQSKPFCYNESYYSIATQTALSGEMKNSLCLNCNADVKSNHSNLSMRSMSPHGLKLVNEKTMLGLTGPLYIIPQPAPEPVKQIIQEIDSDKQVKPNNVIDEGIEENVRLDGNVLIDTVPNIKEDLKHYRKSNGINMEPAVHHKLCDRTRTSISSKKSSVGTEDLLAKDPIVKEIKPKNENMFSDSISVRKNSHSSTGAISRTSSVAKSTVSTHKSNTQVGPGPRFCHLRMQAGSKNILLDNAQPDVPPILYRRQSKCNENSIFKDLNDGMDNFIDLVKTDNETNLDVKKDNVVVDTTLIDVQIDNNTKEPNAIVKNSTINPVLLNVSSSPLQPLKTHNFSNGSENNNNQSQSLGSHHNTSEIENLLSDFQVDELNSQNNNVQPNGQTTVQDTYTNDNDIKIFNFDRYEQTKLASQYVRPLRKIEMAQFHSIENTKISKDFPPQGEIPKLTKKPDIVSKPTLPPVVNVYPNLTQTQLKVNETTKVFTNEQSTSSLSSDDSAALLQKQQLLRVAEWVEQNLEQHNNLDDPSEDDVSFNRALRRDSKLSRLTETLNEIALNMPHPVSKYSKSFNRANLAWLQNDVAHDKNAPQVFSNAKVSKVIKETIFPVECGEASITESKDNPINTEEAPEFDIGKELKQASEANGKEITPEELARMEYNVKKFLLSGPNWANPESVGRSRRTSSRTETDV